MPKNKFSLPFLYFLNNIVHLIFKHNINQRRHLMNSIECLIKVTPQADINSVSSLPSKNTSDKAASIESKAEQIDSSVQRLFINATFVGHFCEHPINFDTKFTLEIQQNEKTQITAEDNEKDSVLEKERNAILHEEIANIYLFKMGYKVMDESFRVPLGKISWKICHA